MISMRLGVRLGLAVLLIATVSAQDFSRSLSPEEFAAAGLRKLSAEELAQLDALVRARGSREAVAAAVARTPTSETAEAERAAPGAAKPARSWRERMRVVLKPGTEIEYETIETQVAGSFRGYSPGHVITLTNGQRWRVVEGTYWAPQKNADQPRKVVIRPGTFGSFFLEIENGGRPKVTFVGSAE